MSEDRELARRVCGLTAGLVGAVAAAGWLVRGPDEAIGAVAGGALTIVNFLWLRWTARVVLRETSVGGWSALRLVLWIGASGARLAVVALALGAVITQGWIGLGGLLVALTALPVSVVAEGLRATRLS